MSVKSLAKLPDAVLEAIENSALVDVFLLEPHQWAIANAYMHQKGNKSIKTAAQTVAIMCPAGYDVTEDFKLIEFLKKFEGLVRYTRTFGEHFMFAEAMRQYMKCSSKNDSRGSLAWFGQMQKLLEKHGQKAPPNQEEDRIWLPEDAAK